MNYIPLQINYIFRASRGFATSSSNSSTLNKANWNKEPNWKNQNPSSNMEKKKDKTKIKDLVYCRDKVLREIAWKKQKTKKLRDLNKKTNGIVWDNQE